MHILKIITILVTVLFFSSCQRSPEHRATKQDQESTLGVYDSALDKAKWTWINNPDGRKLLQHRTISDCYVGYNTEPLGYESPGFKMAKEVRVFQGGKYDVFIVTEKDKLYCITYSKQNSKSAHDLTVYAVNIGGKCQEEAEAIISIYEKFVVPDK